MRRLPDYAMALLRIFSGSDAVQWWFSAFNDPGTRFFRIAQTQDGAYLIWAMGIFGALMIFDVLINDLTPKVFSVGKWSFDISWEKALEQRHWLFVMLAVSYAAHPYFANEAGRPVEGIWFFYLNALQNIVLAFFDVKLRTREIKWQRAYS